MQEVGSQNRQSNCGSVEGSVGTDIVTAFWSGRCRAVVIQGASEDGVCSGSVKDECSLKSRA